MFQYIVKRLLYFVLTFFIISFLVFGLSKLAPGDPVKQALGQSDSGAGQLAEKQSSDQSYLQMSEKMGMNLPTFYFAINSAALPDTLHHIVKITDRRNLVGLINEYGNWPQIEAYYHSLKALEIALFKVDADTSNYAEFGLIRTTASTLVNTSSDNAISAKINAMVEAVQVPGLENIRSAVNHVAESYAAVKAEASKSTLLIPSFKWYGWNNQYHHWMFGNAPLFDTEKEKLGKSEGFLRGDFGKSYMDKRPVDSIIFDAIRWTLLLNFISIIIAYIISIPLGVITAVKKGTRFDRVSTVTLFALYSLPNFWIATILIVFFTTSEYSTWLDWFPTFGVQSTTMPRNASWFAHLIDLLHHMVLPVFCITYGSFAYLSRQQRGGALAVLRMDYIRTAYAKGLDQNTVIWKHVFRNSLIPIITLFAYLFPAAISGSVVIEIIFSIPGMGQKAFSAIFAKDYPIVFTVVMFSAILTMVGNLVADLLYSVVDPRITFTKKA